MLVPLVIASLSMLGPFSIDTPYPAFSQIQHDFGVGPEVTQQLVSAYLLAFAVMSIFHGPLSDAVGRRPVMLGGLAVYAAASVGCAAAPSVAVLIACRVVQGLAAGGSVIVSRTIVRDLYDGPRAQQLMSRVMMIFGLAPAVAPVIGGLLLHLGAWRGIFWFLTAVAVLLGVAVVRLLPETHPRERRTQLRVRALLAGLAEVGRSARFHRVAWAASFLFGSYFLYIGAAAIVVVDLLHRGSDDFWMLFLPLIVGMITGSGISAQTAGRLPIHRLVSGSVLVGLVGAAINVTLCAIPATAGLPYAVLGPLVIGIGAGAGYPNLQLAVLDMFPERRGSAASAVTFLGLVLNAVGAGLLAPLITRSLLTMALASATYVVLGGLLWSWHRRRDASADREVVQPTPG